MFQKLPYDFPIIHIAGPQITNISRWYSQLMTQDVFCESESEVTGNKGISVFKVL